MKKFNLALIALATISASLFTLALEDAPAKKTSYEYLDQQIMNAKTFTLEVFQGMPEENYSFKPGEEMRTFEEQAFHIAYTFEWSNARLSGSPIAWEPGDETRLNKEELIVYATEQMDTFIDLIHNSEENGRLTAGILGTLRHNSHHRGQMVAYYRANRIAPPAYK